MEKPSVLKEFSTPHKSPSFLPVYCKSVLDAIGDAICIYDPGFRILYQNPAHINMLGPHVGELCYRAFHSNERVCDGCPVSKSFEDGGAYIHGKEINTLKGIMHVEITTSILRMKKKTIGLSITRDITKTKEAQKRMGRMQTELERHELQLEDMVKARTAQLNEANERLLAQVEANRKLQSIAQSVNDMNNIGYIFSGIRHELGNPVAAIKTSLEILKKDLDRGVHDTTAKHVERSLSELSRIEHLLRNLKSYNMYEALEIRELDVGAFMDEFIPLIREDLEKQGIGVSFEKTDGAFALADPRALQQVLLNIISNAADALAGRQAPRIGISLKRAKDAWFIRIEDNGHGIPDRHQRELFQPFFTTKPQGTGLGLAISRKMLVKMKGAIEIVSKVDAGTSVIVRLCPSLPPARIKAGSAGLSNPI
ncbi:MAG: ATP-binding protein [Nitrospiraceae bacterium]|nr:ATP-binding protein [Nitrospiraceae bacterium]